MNSFGYVPTMPRCCGSGGHYRFCLGTRPALRARGDPALFFRNAKRWKKIRHDLETVSHNVLYLHPRIWGGTTIAFMQQDPRVVWSGSKTIIFMD